MCCWMKEVSFEIHDFPTSVSHRTASWLARLVVPGRLAGLSHLIQPHLDVGARVMTMTPNATAFGRPYSIYMFASFLQAAGTG